MKVTEKPLTVVLTGGGTGGHIYPAIAVGRRLQELMPRAEIHYMGTYRGLEADLIPKEGWPFYGVTASGLSRKISFSSMLALARTGKGYFEARRHLKKINPRVVFGTGGFVCGPVVLAATTMGIPTLIHEQNAYPGLTNRLLSRVANRVCITFPQSASLFPAKAKLVNTGLPVRSQIMTTSREEGLSGLGLEEGFRVLIVGGSQGARSINQAMLEVYSRFKDNPGIHWLHITGVAGYEEYKEQLEIKGIDVSGNGNIKVMPYIYKMEEALSVADLVIGRAGASFLAEVMGKGLPSILIPYPYASENHQEHNARALEECGGAMVIKERELSGGLLAEKISKLINNPEHLQTMAQKAKGLGKPEALELIVKQITDLAFLK